MEKSFKTLVEKSSKIVISGHTTPDYDAYASMLFVYNIIIKNFKNKEVHMNLDTTEPFQKLKHLESFQDIEYGNLLDKVKEVSPDLLIFVDGPQRDRFFRIGDKFEDSIKEIKSIMIDHHKVVEEDFDLFYNLPRGSAVEVVYDLLIRKENLELFENWEEVYMTGMIGDTYRFYYPYPGYRENFEVVSKALDSKKLTIRSVSDNLFSYNKKEILVLSELFKNLVVTEKYAYTTLDWEYYDKVLKGVSRNDYKRIKRFFVDQFLNQIDGIEICFTLTPPAMPTNSKKTLSGSFRSRPNTYDCAFLATQFFDGGGHVTGAGFQTEATNAEDAIKEVTEFLENELNNARIK